MRGFIVLCLVAVATAQYNYGAGVGGTDSGLGGPSGGVLGGPVGGVLGGPVGGVLGGPVGGVLGGPSYGGGAPVGGEVNKEFFTYTAPEEEFNDAAGADELANSVKQNLRVIFIKGPENNGLENAVLNLAKLSAQRRTAIYVLHKQTDIGDLANKFNAVQNQHNQKPEVHFVKYRTPEDAANAQHQIQSQYDAINGPSSSHNGGIAPVINFASQAPRAPHGGVHQQPHGVAPAPAANYLPASILRSFRRV